MKIAPAIPLDLLTEKDWDLQLFGSQKGVATLLGWKLRYHTLRSKGSTSGFPDRVLVRDRVIFVELKTEKGPTSDAQVEWLDGLATAGAETYLWRPSDADEIARILGRRWEPARRDAPHARVTGLWTETDGYWQPGSLWVPGLGRTDTTEQLQLLTTTKGAV